MTGAGIAVLRRALAVLLVASLAVVLWPAPQAVVAQQSAPSETQEAAGPDYAAWQITAERAEESIERGRASNVA
ncbi:MAG TPA: hypothetical protein VLA45_02735, partial [Paracoccaceae bacterium]|nr:hypothetical protein [Paracoccaceae bacterium]